MLSDVNLKIDQGSRTVLLGANGAGKSTLFYHFNGVYEPSCGTVLYNGQPLRYRRKALMRLRSEVSVVLQNPDDQIFSATVEEDVAFGPRNMGFPDEEVAERVDAALFRTGMSDLRKRGTLKLSYGQRKRLTLAGALAMKPKVLVLDEPTAGLDPQMACEVMELADLMHRDGTAVIISTHDADLAYGWADAVNVLCAGKLTYSGDPDGFYSDRSAVRASCLVPPLICSINRCRSIISGRSISPYPHTVPEIVAKMSSSAITPGKMTIFPVDESASPDTEYIKKATMDICTGVCGTAARKAVSKGCPAGRIFSGTDGCLAETVGGKNSALLCDRRMLPAVTERLDRLKAMGCAVESEMADVRDISGYTED
ncbi:MAG: ATP-binding cassette domain-containing protein [Candidatus Methanoplasma sp.]|nr:ATP-binding cassette domain-containing protein [Candidatus Methanoplasma sp.]